MSILGVKNVKTTHEFIRINLVQAEFKSDTKTMGRTNRRSCSFQGRLIIVTSKQEQL